MLIVSYYIAKDKETQMASTGKATADSKFRKKSINPVQDINLGAYSHQNVDRFGVIMDVWTNEVNFLQMKKNVS